MQLPREPRIGEKLDAAWGAQVIRYLRSITPTGGPGVRARQWAGGTTLEAAEQRGGATAAAEHPFLVADVSTTDPAAAKVSVVFGQVNSITPTIGGTALDADPAPTLTVITGVVYLRVNLDVDGLVTTAIVANAATLPANTATEGYLTLATVTVAANAITALNQAVTHALSVRRCGVSDIHFWGL